MYHVFLSHSSADKPAIEQLARRLQAQAGLNPFLDKWQLVPGESWQPALEQAIAESETAAVFFGPGGPGRWHDQELQLALVRAVQSRDDFRVIPVLLPGANPEQVAGFLSLRTWVDFREGLDSEAAFARLVAGIQGRAPAGDAFTLPDEPAPYRGLRPFDEAHSEFFFGREPDIARTLEKLGRERFVAVVGASGSGKSSLVLSGVLPRLKQPGGILGPGVRIWTMRPGASPLRALSDALAAREASGEQRLSLSDALYGRFLERPDALRTTLATLTADGPGSRVLVVDQFEELFTHAPRGGGTGEATSFVANLRDAMLEGTSPLYILVTLRADFFHRCLGLAPLRELLEDRAVLLGGLGDEALRDVILRPAQKVGAYLEKGLLTAILQDVSREPGALPLLEDALDQLWRARNGAWLTLAAYEASGGISQTLRRRAQACYEALAPEEREVARLILVRLTSLGEGREDTRRRIPRAELAFPGIPEARVEHVLRELSGPQARLIVADQGSVEVAHEVLIRTWPTLRKWLDEDRRELRVQRRLAEAAGEWNTKAREAGYLYTGAHLFDAEELFQRKPALLNQLEREFLEASILQRDQQRREDEEQAKRELEAARRLAEETEARRRLEAEGAAKARRAARSLRSLAIGLLLAMTAVVAGSFLLYQQFRRVEAEKRLALSRELVLTARQNIREDPQRALLLLQEAQQIAPATTLGEQLDEWSREPGLLVLRGHRDAITRVRFSPDGSRILTASEDGTARLWDAASGKPLATLQGHSDGLVSATFSPDGSRILTASADATARLWDASSGKPLTTLQGHSEGLVSATFSPDSSRVLTAARDATARLWDASSGEPLVMLQGHSSTVVSATFSPDGSRVLTASEDGTARLWDAASGKSLLTLQDHSGRTRSAAFSPDGSRILTTTDAGTLHLWNASSGKPLVKFHAPPEGLVSAAFSPDGSRILTASEDGTARLWDLASNKLLVALQGHSEGLLSVTFSPDGSRILTASEDGTARLWDGSSDTPLAVLQGHSEGLLSAAFSPSGSRILTGSKDGTARLWDAAGKPLAMLEGHSATVWSATFSPDGSRVLTASKDGTARQWDAASGKPLAVLAGHSDTVETATFSPDGSRILTRSKDGTARLWDAASDKPLAMILGHSDAVWVATFSPDGSRVLTASEDGTARLWDTASGKPLATLQGHSRGVWDATFSPDGSRILTASADATARLWDAASGKPLATLQDHSDAVWVATFSPDGSRVLTSAKDGTARLWDAASGKSLAIFQGHSKGMWVVTFSPDGARVLTVSRDNTARLWDAASGKPLATLQGHSKSLWVATFSPDGTRVLTASEDGTARLWDTASGKPLATLQGHSDAVWVATFSPDGSRVLTASRDNTVRLWSSWRWEPEAFAKLDVGRTLTCEERRTFLHENLTCTGEVVPSASSTTLADALTAP